MLMHGRGPMRPYKPNPNTGGSKKGKAYNKWPEILLVVFESILTRWKGPQESWSVDRNMMPIDEFESELDSLCPGWEQWCQENFKPCKTPRIKLAKNRGAVQWWNRGGKVRPMMSKEHWKHRHGPETELFAVGARIVAGSSTIKNWKKFLP